MRDVFFHELPNESAADDDPEAAQIRESLDGQFVCPFCGVVNSSTEGLCPRCSMENTPGTRKATRLRVGPWYVYQHRNPAAPGMKFETLLAFVKKGKVKARSIVRGPTTGQLWRFAAHVKGLSRAFSVCYSCGESIEPTTNICPHCKRLQEPPPNPNVLLETSDADEARKAPAARPADPPANASRRPTAAPASESFAPKPTWPLAEDDAPANVAPSVRAPIGGPPVASFRKQPISDNFLSARELATAFNLGFTPASTAGPTARPSPRGRRRRHLPWRRLCILMLLALVAAAFAVPSARQHTLQWGTEGWSKIRPLLARFSSDSRPAPAAGAADRTSPKAVANPHPSTSALPQTGSQASKVIVAAPNKALQNDQTIASQKADDALKSTPIVQKSAPQVASNPPAQFPAKAASNNNPPAGDATEQARALYNQGIDAEQRVDFVSAAAYYEQVKKNFPQEVWPKDLELRIQLARTQAGLK